MPEPVPTLYSLGAAPFSSSFLSNIFSLIASFFIISLVLVNNSFSQPIMNTFIFEAPIHVIMVICILGMDRPAVDLRLPKFPILIAAFWTVVSGRQLQTFILAMSEERTILM